jgi:chemosensory pili system protein ChpC
MSQLPEIYCLLMPLMGIRMLLPNAAIGEIVVHRGALASYVGPQWLLGLLHWHEQVVPVVAYEGLVGGELPCVAGHRLRIAIIHLPAEEDMQAVGIVLQGYPSLIKIEPGVLKSKSMAQTDSAILNHYRAHIGSTEVLIPDLQSMRTHLSTLEFMQPQDARPLAEHGLPPLREIAP